VVFRATANRHVFPAQTARHGLRRQRVVLFGDDRRRDHRRRLARRLLLLQLTTHLSHVFADYLSNCAQKRVPVFARTVGQPVDLLRALPRTRLQLNQFPPEVVFRLRVRRRAHLHLNHGNQRLVTERQTILIKSYKKLEKSTELSRLLCATATPMSSSVVCCDESSLCRGRPRIV
jgi:hypothetical protein